MVFDRTFWLLMLFPLTALAIAVAIVWWTLPREGKSRRADDDSVGRDGGPG